jgi:hypothetical protein
MMESWQVVWKVGCRRLRFIGLATQDANLSGLSLGEAQLVLLCASYIM